jgi:uncharacterized membrane protein YhaH (DUF805 family)
MADASTQCYFLDSARNQQGPVSGGDIARLIRNGTINRDTLMWYPGMADWRPAVQISEFASLFGAPASPTRPPPSMSSMRPAMQSETFGGYENQGTGGYNQGTSGAPKAVGFGGAISVCLGKYANFSGRASRSEFWFWVLFQVLLSLVVVVVGGLITVVSPDAGRLITLLGYGVIILGLFLPGLAVSVRRLHDTDRSGWWLLLDFVPLGGIVLLIFWCLPGTEGPNRFG